MEEIRCGGAQKFGNGLKGGSEMVAVLFGKKGKRGSGSHAWFWAGLSVVRPDIKTIKLVLFLSIGEVRLGFFLGVERIEIHRNGREWKSVVRQFRWEEERVQ